MGIISEEPRRVAFGLATLAAATCVSQARGGSYDMPDAKL